MACQPPLSPRVRRSAPTAPLLAAIALLALPCAARPAAAQSAGAQAAAATPEESVVMRSVEIPGFGTLRFPAPPTWTIGRVGESAPETDGAEGTEGGARAVSFRVLPDTPAHAELNVSFSWEDMPNPAFNGPAALRALVDRMARAALDASIESRYVLRELRSPRGGGYAFSLRARTPRKKSQAYLTSGVFGLGNALVRFSFLAPQPDLPEAAQAINLIAGVRIDDEPAP